MILLSPAVEHPGLPHRNGVNGRRYADFPTLRRKRQAFGRPGAAALPTSGSVCDRCWTCAGGWLIISTEFGPLCRRQHFVQLDNCCATSARLQLRLPAAGREPLYPIRAPTAAAGPIKPPATFTPKAEGYTMYQVCCLAAMLLAGANAAGQTPAPQPQSAAPQPAWEVPEL